MKSWIIMIISYFNQLTNILLRCTGKTYLGIKPSKSVL